jgi:phosphoglycolate phosphatase-like HAD superfamily hydrolase
VNPSPKVIFFDVGNTLLFPNRELIHAPLAECGIVPEGEHLRDLECRTKNIFDGIMTGTAKKNDSTDRSFWWMFYTQLLTEIGYEDDAIRDQLVASIRKSASWDVIRPGTAERLQEIGERYRLAVISNADGKIEEVLSRCGIARCFHTITDSGQVGYEKPHPGNLPPGPQEHECRARREPLRRRRLFRGLPRRHRSRHAGNFDGCPRRLPRQGVPRVESLEDLQIVLRNRELRKN